MSTPTLPAHIGGYQHLEPYVICQEGDIYVRDGKPVDFVDGCLGGTVSHAERITDCRVYREYPCPRQGGERALTEDEMALRECSHGTQLISAEQLARVAGGRTGGGPLPSNPKARKGIPIYSGFLKYFPLAVSYVAQISRMGNDQHNPGQPLHWDRSKSGDELDADSRHLLEIGGFDSDGARHSGKHAWRAMANLQKELEAAQANGEPWFKTP